MFMGAGAKVWGSGTLATGLIMASLIIPVFLYRHYVTDKGKFPDKMYEDLIMPDGSMVEKKAGYLPYLALAVGVAVVIISNIVFTL